MRTQRQGPSIAPTASTAVSKAVPPDAGAEGAEVQTEKVLANLANPLPPLEVLGAPAAKKGVGGGNALSLRMPAGLPQGVTSEALLGLVRGMSDQQWFTGKGREIAKVEVSEHARIDVGGERFEVALLDVKYGDGGGDVFHVPLAVKDGVGDALSADAFVRALVSLVRDDATLPSSSGALSAKKTPGKSLPAQAELEAAAVKALGVPQSNVSIRVGDTLMVKIYRKPEAGTPIEREVTAHLTAQGYQNTPQLLGTLTLGTKSGPTTVGMLFDFVKSDGDGWSTTLEALRSSADHKALGRELALLGTRIGEMHAALGAPVNDAAFAPQAVSADDLQKWSRSIAHEIDETIAAARAHDPALAQKLADARPKLLEKLAALEHLDPSTAGKKTRIHGDLHLGQVLKRGGDWMVLDFEGEPARSKEERRGFYTPLRDVAGMLRSFAYAEAEATRAGAKVPGTWAEETSSSFVRAYRDAVGATRADLMPTTAHAFDTLLAAVELEKALYEVRYELKSRPALVGIPAERVLAIAQGH